MWILMDIVAFIVLLITVILLLPVYIIIKTDQNGEIIFRYKILSKTFGENPDPNNPIVKTLKNITGVARLDKEKLKENATKGNLLDTVSESISLIMGLLKRLLGLLKHCKVNVLKVKIVCGESCVAQAAVNYGICWALISPLLSFIHSSMKIREKGESIEVFCNYETPDSHYEFETVLVVRVFRVLAVLLRAVADEKRRVSKKDTANQKSPKSDS